MFKLLGLCFILDALPWARLLGIPLQLPVIILVWTTTLSRPVEPSLRMTYLALWLGLVGAVLLSGIVGAASFGYFQGESVMKTCIYSSVLPLMVLNDWKCESEIRKFFKFNYIIAAVVVIIGMFGFLNFDPIGFWTEEREYGYYGVRYLPATRNSDVIYPVVLASLSLCGVISSHRKSGIIFHGVIAIFASGCIILSQSRSAWLALIALFALGLRPSVRVGMLFIVFFVILLFSLPLVPLLKHNNASAFFHEKFASIIGAEREDVGSSNDERAALYSQCFHSLHFGVTGVGSGNFQRVIASQNPIISHLQHPESVWAGSFLYHGFVFAWILAFLFILPAALDFKNGKNESRAIIVPLFVLSQFTTYLELYSFWYIMAVATVMATSRPRNGLSLRQIQGSNLCRVHRSGEIIP